LSHGAGAESRQPIGWVIVGGMLLGTLLTLFVVPAAYTLRVRRVRGEEEAEVGVETGRSVAVAVADVER
jgi:multidrug efflux pump